ncbi:MAG TPA: hypothetical protein VLB09_07240 [Nitrospiria bacterium]|nr:hypothetical protein [Nitrospiria bacterium]
MAVLGALIGRSVPGLLLAAAVSLFMWDASWAGSEDEAYQHNRQGMISMGMARFEEAIRSFRKASSLVEDYRIRGRKLEYTPIFHTGWASEKIGERAEACHAFERFLAVVPEDGADPTKIEHAEAFVQEHCH